jgi:hypothetical protein
MNPLDRLEKRFRALFETSASLLPWSNPNDRIVHELRVAIQDLFIGNNIQNQVDAPLFLVNLNPITYHRWREQPDWQATLTYLLTSIAAEFGSHFLKTPLIELRADPALSEDEVSIFLKEVPKKLLPETGILSGTTNQHTDEKTLPIKPTPLLILKGGKTIPLMGNVINIGRKNTNHIIINDLRVSRNHAQIRRVKDEYIIFDAGSTGGTFINSTRIDQHTLRPGDVISLAGYTLIYTIDQIPLEETQKSITSEIKGYEEGRECS